MTSKRLKPTRHLIAYPPFRGAEAIQVGSRILVWDHYNAKVVFVGTVLRKISDRLIRGANYFVDARGDNLFREDDLDLEHCGVLPLPGSFERFANQQFRTYRLLPEADPFFDEFTVTYSLFGKQEKLRSPAPASTIDVSQLATMEI